MNQIEIAISTLEWDATNLVGKLGTTQAGSCQETYITQHIEAINLAQQALREKAKREHGCSFCEYMEDEYTIYTHLDCDGGYITDYYDIHYCPMCGRKLPSTIKENDNNGNNKDYEDKEVRRNENI